LREQECSHTNVGPIDVVFVERPIGDVRFDLEYARIDRVRTVRFAWPIRVVARRSSIGVGLKSVKADLSVVGFSARAPLNANFTASAT
jgi:hypothetical protein